MSVSLPVIVDLMTLFLREKETLTRKYILYSSCTHAKLSFLGWKIGHFTDLFHYQRRRLQSHSPNLTQFCYAIGLPNTIPNTISRRQGTKKRIYRTSKVNKADTMFDLTFDPRQKCSKSNFSSREKRGPTTSNSTACWLENISNSMFYCWHENCTKKLQRPSAVKPTPCNLTRLPQIHTSW